jgi:arylsulfatase A
LDITPLVMGQAGARSPHEAYFFYWNRELQAVRMGRWKLHFPHVYRTLGDRPGGVGGRQTAYRQARLGLSLFDLDADLGETTNVAGAHPQVVQKMMALADQMRARLGDSATDQEGSEVRPVGKLEEGDERLTW